MGFLTTVVVGAIIGWLLHMYLPSGIVDCVDGCIKGVCDKIFGCSTSSKPSTIAPVQPEKADVGESSAKDDLKKIEGIGPKIAGLLNDDGINSFQDLADAEEAKLREILDKAGSRYRIADPTTWPKQASLAAKGEWDALKALKDELKGGREKK